ncbi:1413_t:CDS:2 [Rhizophagus irregularis]|nr:1413_t:CDS:2 [Rhizophagus irregularis]
MYCMRWFIPLLLLPFPNAPPFFVLIFLVSYFLHQRPCTCYWGQGRCWLDTNHGHFLEPRTIHSLTSSSNEMASGNLLNKSGMTA